jgi:hypothetical protein
MPAAVNALEDAVRNETEASSRAENVAGMSAAMMSRKSPNPSERKIPIRMMVKI